MAVLMELYRDHKLVDWAVAGRSFNGIGESGDQYMVEFFENGVLLAVIDGLGHGDRAAVVAKAAVAALKGHAADPVLALIKRCHRALRGTRGVVMSLASLRQQVDSPPGMMTWSGVGNVTGILLRADGGNGNSGQRARESLIQRGGILGYQMPAPISYDLPLSSGDTLILASDGLRSSFAEDLTMDDSPQELADRLFAQHGRGTDDALVLVARILDSTAEAASGIPVCGERG
jgi:serine/threonine protein phosphatase PrpC